jgi:catechol 2,3-dioxygenase-like lactoylglutathione lyase family enzyme
MAADWPWDESLDALAAAPAHHRLVFENAHVRVLDTRIAPGERTPVHAHRWPAAHYVVSWSDFVRRDADDAMLLDTRNAEAPTAPEALWGDPLPPHSLENVGAAPLHVISTEIKAAARMTPRLTSLAPQLLVDDLQRAIAYYRDVLGFSFGEAWEGFYAIGQLDGLELHLKEAPRNPAERAHRRQNEHIDAAAGVDGIDAFYERCVAKGAKILKPLAATEWGTKDFYIEDPDGNVISFGGSA